MDTVILTLIYIAGISCVSQIITSASVMAMPADLTAKVISIAKAYYGLSGALLACVASAFFDNDEQAYILFVAISVPS